MDVKTAATAARRAARECAVLPASLRNAVLLDLASALERQAPAIMQANAADVERARDAGLGEALLDRLALNERRMQEMTGAVRQVAALADPLQEITDGYTVESGLRVLRRRVPFGVIGVIYEARPNVTVDIAALCLKSGNACLLRGGSEAASTNAALHEVICTCLSGRGVSPHAVELIGGGREATLELLGLDECIDLIIPRGGPQLQRLCIEESRIPVITGGFGVSHIFIDAGADLPRSLEVVINAKVQKPSACNALDTLLLHRGIAADFLDLARARFAGHGIVVHADEEVRGLLQGCPGLCALEPGDLDTEWLSLQLSVVLCEGVEQAVAHLHAHQAIHSDAIMTNNLGHAEYFVAHAPSACVYVNASTRFSDGGQFGLGSEVAISTQKLHVRGPMGLRDLTTFQYVLSGDYLVRG